MKAFIDTSSLVKKYVEEAGSTEFEILLDSITEITVSPIYIMEIHSAIARRLAEKSLTRSAVSHLLKEINRDYHYFSRVIWNNNLENTALGLIRKHHLKTLDSIQLASGILSRSDIFIVSDRQLYVVSHKELPNVKMI